MTTKLIPPTLKIDCANRDLGWNENKGVGRVWLYEVDDNERGTESLSTNNARKAHSYKQLFEAAPNMLDALKRVVFAYEQAGRPPSIALGDAIDACDFAIAQAGRDAH